MDLETRDHPFRLARAEVLRAARAVARVGEPLIDAGTLPENLTAQLIQLIIALRDFDREPYPARKEG